MDVLDNATTILGWKSEPQPDALLRVLHEFGGRSYEQEGYIHALRSWSSRSRRGHDTWTWDQKRQITNGPACWNTSFARSNRMRSSGSVSNRACWRRSRSRTMGCFVRRCFLAFGLTRPALEGRYKCLCAVVELGCSTPEHAAFIAQLTECPRPLIIDLGPMMRSWDWGPDRLSIYLVGLRIRVCIEDDFLLLRTRYDELSPPIEEQPPKQNERT